MAFDSFGDIDPAVEWARRIRHIMDEMLNRSFVQFRDCGAWTPQTNVYETADAYLVCVDLAGLRSEHIDVHCLSPTRLRIQGERPEPRGGLPAEAELSTLILEIEQGPFQRELDLPQPVCSEHVEANYEKGLLWIRLPKVK